MRGTKRKRGTDRWVLQVSLGRDRNGRRRFATKTIRAPHTRAGEKQADAELRRLLLEVDAGRLHADTDDLTVADLVDRYITHREAQGRSPATIAGYRWIADTHIRATIGDRPAAKLRADELELLYIELLRSGGRDGRALSTSSVAHVHRLLSAAYNQAMRWGLVDIPPTARVEAPTQRRSSIDPPSPADVARALAEAERHDLTLAVFVRLAFVTGARRGSLVALRWSDVDLDAGVVTFSRAISKGVERSTKTGQVARAQLGVNTVAGLAELEERQRAAAAELGLDAGPDRFVFSSDAGRTPWHPDTASKRWARLRAEVGLEHVRLHDLRHAMATHALASGQDVATVAARGGWANASLLLKVYAHPTTEADRRAGERLEELLDGGG